jgi:hypothetical protein
MAATWGLTGASGHSAFVTPPPRIGTLAGAPAATASRGTALRYSPRVAADHKTTWAKAVVSFRNLTFEQVKQQNRKAWHRWGWHIHQDDAGKESVFDQHLVWESGAVRIMREDKAGRESTVGVLDDHLIPLDGWGHIWNCDCPLCVEWREQHPDGDLSS